MIDPSIETELRAVLDDVPPVNHAFGYGSGVLPQPLRDDEGPSASARDHAATGSVVDFVFAVDDPRAWHRRNMTMNPSHYAPHLRALGDPLDVRWRDVLVGAEVEHLRPRRRAV